MADYPEARAAEIRKADTLAKLQAKHEDIWVASASLDSSGAPVAYVVPLSLAWIDERVVVALDSTSQTARNIVQQRAARLALGPTRDVVLIDATLERAVSVVEAEAAFADHYAGQADWDPREAGPSYTYLVLKPERIQAWRESNELRGRTLMRDGTWLI